MSHALYVGVVSEGSPGGHGANVLNLWLSCDQDNSVKVVVQQKLVSLLFLPVEPIGWWLLSFLASSGLHLWCGTCCLYLYCVVICVVVLGV